MRQVWTGRPTIHPLTTPPPRGKQAKQARCGCPSEKEITREPRMSNAFCLVPFFMHNMKFAEGSASTRSPLTHPCPLGMCVWRTRPVVGPVQLCESMICTHCNHAMESRQGSGKKQATPVCRSVSVACRQAGRVQTVTRKRRTKTNDACGEPGTMQCRCGGSCIRRKGFGLVEGR